MVVLAKERDGGRRKGDGAKEIKSEEVLMIRRMKIVGIGVIFGLCLSSTVMAQDYEIRLHRPVKVGQKFRMSSVGHYLEKSTGTISDKIILQEQNEFSLEFESLVTVLETDKKGDPKRVSLTIEKCIKIEEGVRKSLVSKGTIIIGFSKDKEDVFEINGNPVDSEIQELLAEVITLSRPFSTDDDVFGTKERKKVGDSWKVNAELAAKDLRKLGLGTRKEDIEGTVILEKVVNVGQTECLQIGYKLNIKRMSPSPPSGFVVKKGIGKVQFSWKLPIDTSMGYLEDSYEGTITFIGGNADPKGPEKIIETTTEEHLGTKITYLE